VAIDRVVLLRNAEDLVRQGKLDQAIAEYRRIVDDQPRDWNSANVLGDLYLRAGQIDKAVDEYIRVADSLSQDGFLPKAGALYKKILKIHPHDEQVLLRAADVAAAQKLTADARAYLNSVYEQRQGRGDAAGATEATVRMAALDSSLALELSESAVSCGDWATAVATLQERLRKSPHDMEVLSRLVEVSVQGGLLDVATTAQSQLADAYLEAGSPVEARFITEDLVARHPDDPVHLDRLRRALTMLGEAEAASAVSARLGRHGESLHTSPTEAAAADAVVSIEPPATVEAAAAMPMSEITPTAKIDLSGALEGVKPLPVVGSAPSPPPPPRDLEDVFADLREEAARRFTQNNPAEELAKGLAFFDAGQFDFAVPRLEAASRGLGSRFAASAALGRICLGRGETWHAIEWFERAADAAAPTPADGHRLLYELADALESVGEVARALAICLELQAEAGEYQDVATRVDRLVKVQARG
jgi:tetratricopeptide (TPR) repeat protein